jgi:hypothetical protein
MEFGHLTFVAQEVKEEKEAKKTSVNLHGL